MIRPQIYFEYAKGDVSFSFTLSTNDGGQRLRDFKSILEDATKDVAKELKEIEGE